MTLGLQWGFVVSRDLLLSGPARGLLYYFNSIIYFPSFFWKMSTIQDARRRCRSSGMDTIHLGTTDMPICRQRGRVWARSTTRVLPPMPQQHHLLFCFPSESRPLGLISFYLLFSFVHKVFFLSRTNRASSLDIYIANLFTHGVYYFFFFARYGSRLHVRWKTQWNPSFWARINSALEYGILVANSGFQTWFWYSGIYTYPVPRPACRLYGFFFVRVPLYNEGFIVVNLLLNACLLILSLVHFCLALPVIPLFGYIRGKREGGREGNKTESEKGAEDEAHSQAMNEMGRDDTGHCLPLTWRRALSS